MYQPADHHHRNGVHERPAASMRVANWQPILNVFGRKSLRNSSEQLSEDDRASIQSRGSGPMQEDERAELVSRGFVLPPPRNKANTIDLTDPLEQLSNNAPLPGPAAATMPANPYQPPNFRTHDLQASGDHSPAYTSVIQDQAAETGAATTVLAGQPGGTQTVAPELELLTTKPAAPAVAATPPVHCHLDRAHAQMRAVHAAMTLGLHASGVQEGLSHWPVASYPPSSSGALAPSQRSSAGNHPVEGDAGAAGAAAVTHSQISQAFTPTRMPQLRRQNTAELVRTTPWYENRRPFHSNPVDPAQALAGQDRISHETFTEHVQQTPEGAEGFLEFSSDGDLAELKGGVRSGVVNYKLWLAAAACDVGKVKKAIADGGDLGFELQDTDPRALNYKLRKVSCKPLHVAAAFRGKDDDGQMSKTVVQLLLQARADVNDFASINTGTTKRQLQAIHIAAGTGNGLTVDLLIDYGASPNALALMDGKTHYCPIHDAAWFNRAHVVRLLLQRKARVDSINKDGETALHIAAKLGYVEMAEILLQDRYQGRRIQRSNTRHVLKESQILVDKQDKRGNRPLDLAVSMGQFPPRYLSLFTDCLTHKKKVDAFIKVAHACPSAAPALLRRQGDNSEFHDMSMERISEEWEITLQYGAKHKVISVNTLATLVEHAPQAAIDLLDALTVTPQVVNREANPLPIRANIHKGSDACRIAVAYEDDEDWYWDATHNVGRGWHKELAPPDPKGGREVEVKVLKLEGLISAQLMHCIAEVTDATIFTKLVLHGMLKYVWSRIHILFIFELTHEVLTAVIMSLWVISNSWSVKQPCWLRRWAWIVVTSQGLVEVILCTWGCILCVTFLGKSRLLSHAKRNANHLALSILTLSLARRTASCDNDAQFAEIETPWFSQGTRWCLLEENYNASAVNRDIMLAVTVLMKWISVLYNSRAFAWTGKKIVPIFNAVQGVVGLVIVVVFCMVGFTLAFWSLDREKVTYLSFMNVFTLLVTGEHQLGEVLGKPDAFPEVVLALVAVVFVSIIILNVFIAVLADTYFDSRKRMVSGYLRERASICTNYFLRPKLRIRAIQTLSETWLMVGFVCTILFLYAVHMLILLLADVLEFRGNFFLIAWFLAWLCAIVEVYLHAVVIENRTTGWHTKKLWICHERYVSEDDFLAPEQREEISQHNRIMTIKQYVHDQCRTITLHTKSIWGALGYLGQAIHYIEERSCDAAQRLADTEEKLEALLARDAGPVAAQPHQTQRSGNPTPSKPCAGAPFRKLGHLGHGSSAGSSGSMQSDGSRESLVSQEEFPELKEQMKAEQNNIKLFRLGQGLPTLYESSSSEDDQSIDTVPAKEMPQPSSLKGAARSPRTPPKKNLRTRFKVTADAAVAVGRRAGPPTLRPLAADPPSRSDSQLMASVVELRTMVKRIEKQLEAQAECQRRLDLSQKRIERNVGNIAETLQILMDTAKKRGKSDQASPSPERSSHRTSRKEHGDGHSIGAVAPSPSDFLIESR